MGYTIQELLLHNLLQRKHCNQSHFQILLHCIKETSMEYQQKDREI